MATVSRAHVVGLYRDMIRASKLFTNYNFREYALRSVRERFRDASAISGESAVLQAYQEGRVQLDMLRRQSAVSQLFPHREKHAME